VQQSNTPLEKHRPVPHVGKVLSENESMNLLYDSDTFAVMHVLANAAEPEAAPVNPPLLQRHGFEIVDKRSGKEVYLDGSWAEMFQQQIQHWQQHTPTQEEVEDTLEGYTGLAQQPVRIH
jgi:hypothetical protein